MKNANLEVDLMKLFVEGSTEKWNVYLTNSLKRRDLQGLINMRYGMQIGMVTLAKKKLNSDRIVILYLRWLKSLETTAKQILKLRHPLPGDNIGASEDLKMDSIHIKRHRDNEFEKFILRSSY